MEAVRADVDRRALHVLSRGVQATEYDDPLCVSTPPSSNMTLEKEFKTMTTMPNHHELVALIKTCV